MRYGLPSPAIRVRGAVIWRQGCFIKPVGVFKPTTIGTPQGGVVSPRLANIVLNHLDWQLDRVGLRFVRYADDFVVLTPTPEQAKEALALVEQVLDGGLGLPLSREKTKVTSFAKGYAFFGFTLSQPFSPHAAQVGEEVQRQDSGIDPPEIQSRWRPN